MDNQKRKLVICEKPSVARALAQALGCKRNTKTAIEGKDYVISWCLGHLVETAQAAAYGDEYIKWSYEKLPIIPEEWKYEVKPAVKEQFTVLKKLMKDKQFSEVVCATDAGREGELIFRLVYEKAGCRLPIKRLWLSSMEESAILEGFANLKDGSEYDNLYQSALARQKADWLVGINGTRLFSVLYGHKVHKVGRVQSPTLSMIVMREQEIREFKKKPFYTVQLETNGLQAVSERMDSKEEAQKLADACNKAPLEVLRIRKEEKMIAPPKPFDLTGLQEEANRLLGFTAKQTLEYTQSLYEQKLCTYPRTDSRYLSNDMNETAGRVLEAVADSMGFAFMSTDPYEPNIKAILDSSKVTDHHAIIPTERISTTDSDTLSAGEQKILILIATGFFCSTMKPARETVLKADLECGGARFTAVHTIKKEMGWKSVYEAMKRQFSRETDQKGNTGKRAEKPDNQENSDNLNNYDDTDDTEEADDSSSFSNLVEGMRFPVRATVKEGFTKPPKRFTEATLLSAMEQAGAKETDNDAERKGLGTPATRADIIEKLITDKYVKREKKVLIPTDAGTELVTILPEIVRSPKLTADWENALLKISRGEMKAEEFLNGIEKIVRELVERYSGLREEKGRKKNV